MAITLQDYEKWLEDATADRTFLVLITGYNPTLVQEETFYFSTKSFQSEPTDTLPNIQFRPSLNSDPTFSRAGFFYGDKIGNDDFGTISINNKDGELDFFQNYLWRNRQIIILLGDVSWDYDNFLVKPFIEGVIDDRPEFSNDYDITFNLLDKTGRLDREIQENLLGTGSSNEDKPLPDSFGRVKNLTPILIDKVNQKYKWHSGQVQDLTNVYDKGLPLTPTTGYTIDNTNGEFTLINRPAGDITIDGDGGYYGGWLQTTRDIVQYLASKELTYPSDFNTDSLDQLDVDKPYLIGWYSQSERVNILDILEDLLASVGCFFFIGYDGKFNVNTLKDPLSETPTTYFSDKLEIHKDTLVIESLNWLQYRTFINYGKNWTIQSLSNLSEYVELADTDQVDFVLQEYRSVVDTDLTVVPFGTDYFSVKSPEAINTFIVNKSDAETEAAYVQTILGKQRFLCTFNAFYLSGKLLPGDFINVTHDRHDLESGKNMQVLSNRYVSQGVSEIKAWY